MAEYFEFAQRHPFLIGGFVAIFALIAFTEYQRLTQKFSDMSPADVVSALNKGEPLLLDVRESSELSTGKIDGAKHIPMSDLAKRIKELDQHKGQEIIVYCRTGNRSASACRMLEKAEYTQLAHLAGGIAAWETANLPLKKR